ncbi:MULTISPECIES: hypothetical protein [Bacillota]|uniref:hypothetical protein n=1 Tax=Bacillota TaxID=1239 RepID=UPI0034BEC872
MTLDSEKNKNILEVMRSLLGLDYISDLRTRKVLVKDKLDELSLDFYSEKQIEELCNYVFGDDKSIYTALIEKRNEIIKKK